MPLAIKFVSVIGRNNSPLYLRSFDDSAEQPEGKSSLQYHFLSHMALDYIISQLGYSETTRDYALLLVHDGIAVYGSLTNTGVKFLVGTNAYESAKYDLGAALRSIHKAFISYMCNPFSNTDENEGEITSKAFDNSIKKIVTAWNTATGGV
ncbi:TRAPP-associated protein Tca17p [Trichomonascus vanleenenianus]|uniref:TRAPP-associated protein Tca17p n=1 Tax=Trichomonascus vanleenenianus TaxID=2268995 RepID=UPI003ECB5766